MPALGMCVSTSDRERDIFETCLIYIYLSFGESSFDKNWSDTRPGMLLLEPY